MDPFFFANPSHDELELWDLSIDPSFDLPTTIIARLGLSPSPVARRSAFSIFTDQSTSSQYSSKLQHPRSGHNIHRRIIELMHTIHSRNKKSKGRGGNINNGKEESRGFRHMMRERQRRERLSQSYADLYSVLPPHTKADKNSIVQAATTIVREMKGVKEGLQHKNEELMRRAELPAKAEGTIVSIDQKKDVGVGGVITLQATNPASSLIDSVIDALSYIDQMDVKARAIRTEIGNGNGRLMTSFIKIETDKILENKSLWLL